MLIVRRSLGRTYRGNCLPRFDRWDLAQHTGSESEASYVHGSIPGMASHQPCWYPGTSFVLEPGSIQCVSTETSLSVEGNPAMDEPGSDRSNCAVWPLVSISRRSISYSLRGLYSSIKVIQYNTMYVLYACIWILTLVPFKYLTKAAPMSPIAQTGPDGVYKFCTAFYNQRLKTGAWSQILLGFKTRQNPVAGPAT